MSGDTDKLKTNGFWVEKLIVWLVAALLAYGAVDARVRVLEDRWERMQSDVAEIKSDVKALIRGVAR